MLLGLQPGPRATFCPWTSILCERWSSRDCPVYVCQDLDSTGHVCPIRFSAHLGQWVVDLISVLAAHCGICCGVARVELTRRSLVCKPREQKQRSQPMRNWKKHEVQVLGGLKRDLAYEFDYEVPLTMTVLSLWVICVLNMKLGSHGIGDWSRKVGGCSKYFILPKPTLPWTLVLSLVRYGWGWIAEKM